MGYWDIQALLCARICHDLSGVVGATAAGMELLRENLVPSSDDDANVISFVSSAADGAVARVRFLRLALGPAASSHPTLTVRQTVEGYLSTLGDGSVSLGWFAKDEALHGIRAKILANMIAMVGDGITKSGQMNIRLDGGQIEVSAHADRLCLPPVLTAFLTGQTTEITPPQTPKEAQVLLLHALVAERNAKLDIIPAGDGNGVTLTTVWHDQEN